MWLSLSWFPLPWYHEDKNPIENERRLLFNWLDQSNSQFCLKGPNQSLPSKTFSARNGALWDTNSVILLLKSVLMNLLKGFVHKNIANLAFCNSTIHFDSGHWLFILDADSCGFGKLYSRIAFRIYFHELIYLAHMFPRKATKFARTKTSKIDIKISSILFATSLPRVGRLIKLVNKHVFFTNLSKFAHLASILHLDKPFCVQKGDLSEQNGTYVVI